VINSARSILRRLAQRLRVPTATTNRSSKRTSSFTSFHGNPVSSIKRLKPGLLRGGFGRGGSD
jgi:hypothetical protein